MNDNQFEVLRVLSDFSEVALAIIAIVVVVWLLTRNDA